MAVICLQINSAFNCLVCGFDADLQFTALLFMNYEVIFRALILIDLTVLNVNPQYMKSKKGLWIVINFCEYKQYVELITFKLELQKTKRNKYLRSNFNV